MAVPGSPLDPRHRGTNQLLRDGATLVRSAADVIAALGPLVPDRHRAARPATGAETQAARPTAERRRPPTTVAAGPGRGADLLGRLCERLGRNRCWSTS